MKTIPLEEVEQPKKGRSKTVQVDWELWRYLRNLKDDYEFETMADTLRAIIKGSSLEIEE